MPSTNGKRRVILHPSIGLFTFENHLSFVFYFYLLSSSYPVVDKNHHIDEREINPQFRRQLSVDTLRNVWHQEKVRARSLAVELEYTVSSVLFNLASTCPTFPAVIKPTKSH